MSDVHSSSQTLANTSTKLVQGELTWLGCFFLPTTVAELFLYKETKLLIYTYVENTLPTSVGTGSILAGSDRIRVST